MSSAHAKKTTQSPRGKSTGTPRGGSDARSGAKKRPATLSDRDRAVSGSDFLVRHTLGCVAYLRRESEREFRKKLTWLLREDLAVTSPREVAAIARGNLHVIRRAVRLLERRGIRLGDFTAEDIGL